MKINTKFFSVNSTARNGTLISIFGFKFAFNVFGNCFSPALCFSIDTVNPRGSANPIHKLALTYRSRSHDETTFYFSTDLNFEWSFGWNSEHLARRFGTFHETDFGGFHQWNRFGSHVRL